MENIMKFANKLFLATTAALTIIFTVFGVWMLSSYFTKILNREMEQADAENRMFQLLFEMAYQPMTTYGEEYAIKNAGENVAANMEKDGSRCFIWSEETDYYGDTMNTAKQLQALCELTKEFEGELNYANGIRQLNSRFYLLSVSKVSTSENIVYLGISKDVTSMYEDRQELMNQYRLALVLLLVIGGACIYVLSRYITEPIRTLDIVVEQISNGDYEQRSTYKSADEIGTLAENFNHMADRLMEQMHEKELEVKRQESFTAAFAHELKTPLTSIIGYADMLNSITMSEAEQREAYYYIYSQGKRLENLSHKLLELVSRIRHLFR